MGIKQETITKIIGKAQRNAPQLTVTDEVYKDIAVDAFVQAQADGFDEPLLSIAAGWLAAHYAFVAAGGSSNVSKQKADVLEMDYFDRGGTSDYLTQYENLKNSITGGSGSVVSLF